MASNHRLSFHQNGYYRVDSQPGFIANPIHTEHNIKRKPLSSTRDHELYQLTTFDVTESEPSPVGQPTSKKRFYQSHGWVLISSIICFTLAIVSIASEAVSWRLGVIYQLIAVGFFLSIMNLGLGSVAPTCFILLEAQFGKSTIQNYDGILTCQPFGFRLSLCWRIILSLMLALPIGLSVAYKTFIGGSSQMSIDTSHHTGNLSTYGMFGPPGLQSNTGVNLFSNATLPFVLASSLKNGQEPPIPSLPQAYGFNILLLGSQTTAILDVPHPDYIASVQSSLKDGESWIVSAPVFGTVAKFNQTRTKDNDTCVQYYQAAKDSSGALTFNSLMNNRTVCLVNHPSPGPQNVQYIAVTTDQGINYYPKVADFCRDAYNYDVTRQLCQATWSISPSSVHLASGFCNGTVLADTKQLIITETSLFIGVWYMSALAEFLEPFSLRRQSSPWKAPSISTAIAAAVWSRITVLNAFDISTVRAMVKYNLTAYEVGVIYRLEDRVIHVRPTLRKSPLLYFILAVPLLITIFMLLCITMFTSVPLSPGFGMISILAGINPGSLKVLEGASLSGNLARDVQLTINSVESRDGSSYQNHAVGKITYNLTTFKGTNSEVTNRTGRLRRGIRYY